MKIMEWMDKMDEKYFWSIGCGWNLACVWEKLKIKLNSLIIKKIKSVKISNFWKPLNFKFLETVKI